jgi:hypothetical protein
MRHPRLSALLALAPFSVLFLTSGSAWGAWRIGAGGGAAPASYVEGPPPGHTGGFGEPTCRACHFEGALDDPAGALELSGLPERPEPGATYELALRLRHPDLRRAGFQLAARFASGGREGEDAGTLEAGEGQRVAGNTQRPVTYLQHTAEGTRPDRDGEAEWTFRWTAPPGDSAAILFHVAANAANDNLSEFGDLIYALEVEVPPPAHSF